MSMNNFVMNMPMVCNQRNRTPSQIDVLRSAKYNLERIIKDASDEQVRQRDNVISQNPYFLQMCQTSVRCRYGMQCPGCRYLGSAYELRRMGEEVAKELILARIVSPERTKTMLPLFSGDFPKAARYIAYGR